MYMSLITTWPVLQSSSKQKFVKSLSSSFQEFNFNVFEAEKVKNQFNDVGRRSSSQK